MAQEIRNIKAGQKFIVVGNESNGFEIDCIVETLTNRFKKIQRKNKMTKEAQEVLTNKQHINDLQFRLDTVTRYAKSDGQKVRIGSTMPYAAVAKREARKQEKLRKRQFGSFRSKVTGKSLTYLKDGEYLPR